MAQKKELNTRMHLPMKQKLKIIEEVEKRRVLWDPTYEYFSNRDLKNDAWKKIATRMPTVPGDLDAKLTKIKANWTYLKDKFTEYCNKNKYMIDGLAKRMEFMRQQVQTPNDNSFETRKTTPTVQYFKSIYKNQGNIEENNKNTSESAQEVQSQNLTPQAKKIREKLQQKNGEISSKTNLQPNQGNIREANGNTKKIGRKVNNPRITRSSPGNLGVNTPSTSYQNPAGASSRLEVPPRNTFSDNVPGPQSAATTIMAPNVNDVEVCSWMITHILNLVKMQTSNMENLKTKLVEVLVMLQPDLVSKVMQCDGAWEKLDIPDGVRHAIFWWESERNLHLKSRLLLERVAAKKN